MRDWREVAKQSSHFFLHPSLQPCTPAAGEHGRNKGQCGCCASPSLALVLTLFAPLHPFFRSFYRQT